MEDKRVYLTRDKYGSLPKCRIEVYPAVVGIRKFHGCIQYGAAEHESRCNATFHNERGHLEVAKKLTEDDCHVQYCFIPEPGTAWYVDEKGKHSSVDIAFSNKKGY